MKYFIQLLLIVSTNLCLAQSGNISLKSREGRNCTFIYQPAKGLTLPEGSYVHAVIIQAGEAEDDKKLPLVNLESHFEFSADISDELKVVFFTINDSNNKIIDSNNGIGFIEYLKEKDENFSSLLFELNNVDYAYNTLGLNISDQRVLERYEGIIQEIPDYRNTPLFLKLLKYKYNESHSLSEKESITKEVLSKLENVITEEDLFDIYDFFIEIKRDDYVTQAQEQAYIKYPSSFLAGRYFLILFQKVEEKSNAFILEQWEEFQRRFPKNKYDGDMILYQLISRYLEENDITKLEEIEPKFHNIAQMTSFYNEYAWNIAINETASREKVTFAALISKKSIDLISKSIIVNTEKRMLKYLKNRKDTYSDTYAYLLNKQGKFEEAFEIENGIPRDGNIWIDERAALYAENYKGQMFAKNILEDAIIKNGGSPAMLKQLKNIYEKQNLPLSHFNEIFSFSEKLNKQKINDGIIAKFSSLKAPVFTLKNLKGNSVKLEDLKGKVVVVDFWATWCGPCIASMPKMQELANKYNDVEFLFIDTFERGDPAETQKKVENLISKNKYNFNVLLDVESAVSKAYKVDYIPSKFIIGKDGKILALDPSEDSMVAIFEENK